MNYIPPFPGSEEVQRGSSADLNLSDVTFIDDEEYTCTLVYPQGEISSAPVDIHVRGKYRGGSEDCPGVVRLLLELV